MRLIADLHIHSRYSRATSPEMDLPGLAYWAKRKGIDLLGTGDFTHPEWLANLKRHLRPAGNGFHEYRGVDFLLTAEIAAVWREDGRGRRVHLLAFAPSIEAASRINHELGGLGRLDRDGRPMINRSVIDVVEAIWGAAPDAVVIPAHAWTPWYSVFGSKSGFDSLEACFGPYVSRIPAIETGLSSDPAMNWRVSALDGVALISCSDAHSPHRLGREVTLFDLKEPGYGALVGALRVPSDRRCFGTVEVYPQEGKYHYDGHRKCNVVLSPAEAEGLENLCPVCGKPLTKGVLHRVEELADREGGQCLGGVAGCCHLVPLEEIIAQAVGIGPNSRHVAREYDALVGRYGNEFRVLLSITREALARATSPRILEAIMQVRAGNVRTEPGYDGVYGRVSIPLATGD